MSARRLSTSEADSARVVLQRALEIVSSYSNDGGASGGDVPGEEGPGPGSASTPARSRRTESSTQPGPAASMC